MCRTKSFQSIAELARQAGICSAHLYDILKGRRNASLDSALSLAGLTKTDPRLWGRGGSAEARQAAYQGWRADQEITRL